MAAVIGDHYFIHTEVLLVSKPTAAVAIQVIKDGPDL
jgi:hypothetical protein